MQLQTSEKGFNRTQNKKKKKRVGNRKLLQQQKQGKIECLDCDHESDVRGMGMQSRSASVEPIALGIQFECKC